MPSDLGKRILAFVRSVLPAEPAHLLLLLGATFLFISHGLRWGLSWGTVASYSSSGHQRVEYQLWVSFATLMTLSTWAAGSAAGFVCLVQTRRPLRRLVLTVLLPALVTFLVIPIIGSVWFPSEVGLSVFSVDGSIGQLPQATPLVLRSLGPGLQIAAMGFILVAIFTVLFSWGRATLPVRLRRSFPFATPETTAEEDHRTVVFVWIMVCIITLTNILSGVIGFALYRFVPRLVLPDVLNAFADQVVAASTLFLLVLLALGKDRTATLRCALALPPLKYVAIAALIPLGAASVRPLVSYFLAVNHWFVYEFRSSFPSLRDYFWAPSATSIWLLLPAFVEEIAWRGYLQPHFVKKYGIMRGIFLVGIVWGAFHFAGDFRSTMTTAGALTHIARRLMETVVQAYVLGWLAIRSRSILPSTVCHAVFNMTVLSGISPASVRNPYWVYVMVWAVVGYVLFRYFPLPPNLREATSSSTASCEPAL